jgi:hypothetical protein
MAMQDSTATPFLGRFEIAQNNTSYVAFLQRKLQACRICKQQTDKK